MARASQRPWRTPCGGLGHDASLSVGLTAYQPSPKDRQAIGLACHGKLANLAAVVPSAAVTLSGSDCALVTAKAVHREVDDRGRASR